MVLRQEDAIVGHIQIEQIACLQDNYGFLIHDVVSGQTATVDTPEAKPILDVLEQNNWRLTHIFNTHHHYDHVGANLELKEHTQCEIIGPVKEKHKIPGIDKTVDEGDIIYLGKTPIHIMDIGGHTLGHIGYHLFENKAVFVGDTMFALGCGRIFEGTAEQMWVSLQKIAHLPLETHIYCAHEYTESNGRFALSIDIDNENLKKRMRNIIHLRRINKATIPTTVREERETNPFLRPYDMSIRKRLNMQDASDIAVFTEIRKRKDNV